MFSCVVPLVIVNTFIWLITSTVLLEGTSFVGTLPELRLAVVAPFLVLRNTLLVAHSLIMHDATYACNVLKVGRLTLCCTGEERTRREEEG